MKSPDASVVARGAGGFSALAGLVWRVRAGDWSAPGMPYFFAQRDGDRVEITGTDARHLARSLRARPGETISVVEPAGRLLTVRLESVAEDRVRGRVEADVEHRPEPGQQVTLTG